MAKLLKRTNIKSEKIDMIRDNLPKYHSIWRKLCGHMNDEKEQVYMLIFNSKEECIGKYNISLDEGAEDCVAPDKEKIEQLFKEMEDAGISKWGLAHNHPYVEKDGKWVQTLISPGDICSTNATRQVAALINPELDYVGHYVVNKEDDNEKIICMEEGFKFNKRVLDKVERMEI